MAAILLVGGLLWAGWYVYNRGFTRKWRDQLTAELRRRGFDLTYHKLTLNPFEGLVVEEAHLYLLDPRAPGRSTASHLLYIKRAAVDLSLANLIQKKPFLNSLDLRDARLTIPVDHGRSPTGPSLRLRHFQAKLAILPGEVRLTQAQGDFYGVQITFSGTLLHPEKLQSRRRPRGPGGAGRAAASSRARSSTKSRRCAPTARRRGWTSVSRGTLPSPATCAPMPSSRQRPCVGAGCLLDRVFVRADYAAGAFHLQQVELADKPSGTLAAQGDYNPTARAKPASSSRAISICLRSRVNLRTCPRSTISPFREPAPAPARRPHPFRPAGRHGRRRAPAAPGFQRDLRPPWPGRARSS